MALYEDTYRIDTEASLGAIQDAFRALSDHERVLEDIGDAGEQASRGAGRAESALNKLGSTARRISGGLKSAGEALRNIGASAALISAPLVAGFSGAVWAATDFNEAMVNTQAVLGASADEMAVLTDEILAVGESSRAGPQAVAEAFYDIVGGVSDASTHMAILEASVATAEAGNAELAATTSGLISVMNAYNFEAEQAGLVSDVFTQTVAAGVGSMDEFVSSMSPVAGLMSSAGISFDELGASMAYMTTQGFSASQSATGLQASVTAFLKPNEAMKDALEEMGFATGDAALAELGLVGAVGLLNETMGGSPGLMAEALGSTEALNAALVLGSEDALAFQEDFVESMDGATEAAQAIQLESFAAQFDLVKASISTLSIEIGLVLLPVLAALLSRVRPVLDRILEWVRANPRLVTAVAAVTAGLAGLGGVLAVVGQAMIMIAPALPVLAGGLGLMLGPVGLLVAALAALGVAYRTNFLGFGDAVRDIGERLEPLGERARAALDGLDFSGLKTQVEAALNSLSGFSLTGFKDSVQTAIDDHLGDLSLDTSGLGDTLSGLNIPTENLNFSAIGDLVADHLLDAILIALPMVFGGPAGLAIGAAKLVVTAFETDFLGFRTALEESGVITSVTDGAQAIWDAITGFFGGGEEGGEGGADSSTLDSVISTIETTLQPLVDFLSGLGSNIEPGLTAIKDGIVGFFTAFEGTETEGITSAMEDIANVLIAIVGGLIASLGPVLEAGSVFLGGALTTLGDFLPKIGEMMSSLVTTLSRLLEGDFSGAAESFVNAISSFISGLAGLAAGGVETAINAISTLISGLAGLAGLDASAVTDVLDGFATSIGNLPADIGATLSGWGESLNTALVDPIKEQVQKARDYFTGDGFDSLKSRLSDLPARIIEWLASLPVQLGTALTGPFLSAVLDIVGKITGEDPEGLKAKLLGLGASVITWLVNLAADVETALLTPFVTVVDSIWSKLTGDEEGSLTDYITQLPGKIKDALSDLLGTLQDYLLAPFENVINEILGKLNFVGDIVNGLLGIGGGGTDTMDLGAAEGNGGMAAWPPKEKALGGRVFPGEQYIVGERGWELFRPDVPGRIIPHQESKRMARQMEPARPLMMPQLSPALAGPGAGTSFFGDMFFQGVQNPAQFLRQMEQVARRQNKSIIRPAGVRHGR